MRFARLFLLGALLTTQACDDVTEPVYEDATTAVTATALAATPQIGDVGPAINLPPIQPKPTFWTCARTAEGIFASEATQILILELRALTEPDPFRQSVMLAEVARRKHEAKKALYFALEQCVATYGAPRWFAIEDENGSLVFVPFTVGAYHAYLVEKYLESPE